MSEAYDIIGKKFGRYTVLKRVANKNTRQSRWLCKCDCGVLKEVKGLKLVRNEIKSCGCWKIEKDHTNTWDWRGFGEISLKYWNHFKKSAERRNYCFSITIEDAWKKFLSQKRMCALSGESICFVRNYHNQKLQTASLDRIDSKKGYTIDNVQWVHKDINKLKNNFEQQRILDICKNIFNSNLHNKIHENKINKDYILISKAYWNKLKAASIKRKHDFSISLEYAWNKFLDQDGLCFFTKEKINFVSDYSRNSSKQTASLDRIDSKKGYIIGNIQWVHKDVNKIKSNFEEKKFLNLCELIYDFNFYRN